MKYWEFIASKKKLLLKLIKQVKFDEISSKTFSLALKSVIYILLRLKTNVLKDCLEILMQILNQIAYQYNESNSYFCNPFYIFQQ